MPRQMRIGYAGAIYHVISRGDQREPIFLDEGNRYDFLKTLGEGCAKTGFASHDCRRFEVARSNLSRLSLTEENT
jgi:hypothetical protein